MAKEQEKEYRKAWPILTREQAREAVARGLDGWRQRRPAHRPHLGFAGPDGLRQTVKAIQSAADPQTVRRRVDLERTIERLLHRHWLGDFDHRGNSSAMQRALGFPIPTYRRPDELVSDRLIMDDARHQLWQRDLGNALPALALGAHLFPDRANLCVERMKGFILAALDFPTWGAWEPYVNMDLAVDHLARGIGIAYDWHPTIWTDAEKERMFTVLRERVETLLRGAYGEAFWARAWAENHCSNAFSAMGIAGAAFLDEIPEAAEWLGAAVAGSSYVVGFRNADGSSDEGIPYWSYGMSFLLQFIELTKSFTGADSLYDTPHMQNGGYYRLHSSLPDLSGALTYGDAFLRDSYGPAHVFYALARRYRDKTLQWFGDAIPFPNGGGADVEAWTLLWRDRTVEPKRPADLPLDRHIPDWDVAVTRSGWSANDYMLAVKSGFTHRNHTHLDAGALLCAWGGQWLIEAPGYGKVGPGFWEVDGPRWTYYSNATESQSTLLIDGLNQRIDKDARGTITRFETAKDLCYVSVDLSQAYSGDHRVRRQVLHRRLTGGDSPSGYILVLDEIEATAGSESPNVEWLGQPGRTATIEREGDESGSNGAPVTVRDIRIAGERGTIRMRSLVGDGEFVSRMPQSEHIDIPREAIRTFALRASGQSPAFAVLIVCQPAGACAEESIVDARVESWTAGSRRIVVSGHGFSDVLTSSGHQV